MQPLKSIIVGLFLLPTVATAQIGHFIGDGIAADYEDRPQSTFFEKTKRSVELATPIPIYLFRIDPVAMVVDDQIVKVPLIPGETTDVVKFDNTIEAISVQNFTGRAQPRLDRPPISNDDRLLFAELKAQFDPKHSIDYVIEFEYWHQSSAFFSAVRDGHIQSVWINYHRLTLLPVSAPQIDADDVLVVLAADDVPQTRFVRLSDLVRVYPLDFEDN